MNQDLQEKLMHAFREVISKVCSSDTSVEKTTFDNCLSDITLRIRLEKSKTNDNIPSQDNFSIELLNCPPIESLPSLTEDTFKSKNDCLFNKFNQKNFIASKKLSVKDLAFWFNQQKFKHIMNENVDQKYLRMMQFEPNNLQNKSVQTEDVLNLFSSRLVSLPEEVLRGAFNYLSRSENLTNYGRAISSNNEHENIIVSINFSNAIKLMTLFLAINTIVLLKFILWEQFSNFFF